MLCNEAYAQEPQPTTNGMDNYQLQQIVIVSRHGLRSPLTDGANDIKQAVSLQWPKWNTKPGLLTTKGGAIEVYMGGYFIDWLNQEGLLKKDVCPTENDLYVYTNVMPRTIATAQNFLSGAFSGCQITVNHLANVKDKDPLFFQSVKDNSDQFKNKATAEINKFIAEQKLAPSYKKLQDVINYSQSNDCLDKKVCDLSTISNSVNLDYGQEPSLKGPLKTSFAIIDAFILQNYEGFPANDVAWGKIKTDADWKALAKLRNSYIEAAYNQPIVVKNIIRPMLSYLDTKLPKEMTDKDSKVTLIVGHDTTVGPIINAIGFNDYTLPGQYEKTPISGKLVFERWVDKKTNAPFLKVEYIYQTTQQMRELSALTLDNPPGRTTLTLKNCKTNKQGLCPWGDFKKILNKAIN